MTETMKNPTTSSVNRRRQPRLDALKSLNRLKLFGSLDNLDQMRVVGPLTLDSVNNRVYIIPHTELQLAPDAYEALYMLAIRENATLTFEQIFDSIWDEDDCVDRHEEALLALDRLIAKINAEGGGFIWIEQSPALSYTLRTKWGHNRDRW